MRNSWSSPQLRTRISGKWVKIKVVDVCEYLTDNGLQMSIMSVLVLMYLWNTYEYSGRRNQYQKPMLIWCLRHWDREYGSHFIQRDAIPRCLFGTSSPHRKRLVLSVQEHCAHVELAWHYGSHWMSSSWESLHIEVPSLGERNGRLGISQKARSPAQASRPVNRV